jgi:hypothetical protein
VSRRQAAATIRGKALNVIVSRTLPSDSLALATVLYLTSEGTIAVSMQG